MICGLGAQGPATAKGFIGEWCSVDDRYIPIGDYEGACHKAIIKRNSFEEHEAYCHILRVLENWTELREIGSRVVAQCEGEGEVHMRTLEFVTQKVFYTLRVGMMGGNDDEKASCYRRAASDNRDCARPALLCGQDAFLNCLLPRFRLSRGIAISLRRPQN